MTPDLDKLAALAGAATPGPWFHQGTLVHGPDKGGLDIGPVLGWHDWAEADAAYIAAANPSVVLALVERVRTLEDEAAYAIGGLNDPEILGPIAKKRLKAVLGWPDPHDAADDEAAARWTAARIDGGVGQ